jgi:hypothetical protein
MLKVSGSNPFAPTIFFEKMQIIKLLTTFLNIRMDYKIKIIEDLSPSTLEGI